MTATHADSGGGLAAKGLDISLAALQRQDPYINNIMDVASQVALYTYNNRANEWEKTEVEGTLFIYTRLASPKHGFTIMNRLRMENLTEPITKDLDFLLQHPFLLYRNARLVIHGIWFYDKADCQRIAQRMTTLTQHEQAAAQSQGSWLSLERDVSSSGGGKGGGSMGVLKGEEGKEVDIIQMLTKAHTEYDKEKSTSEPKEIGVSSFLYGGANLIKPIPVKPPTQDSDGGDSRSLSVAMLFGSHVSKRDPALPGRGKDDRPPAARTLTYEPVGGQKGRENASLQQRQQQPCHAIQKLMQGQRAPAGGILHTLSESPENKLCDNDHHHLHHHYHPHQQLDPIKRLFSYQPPTHAHPTPCCNAPSQHTTQPIIAACSACPRQPHVLNMLPPHELLHKLQLVQQEQSLASPEPPRLGPALAPRFQRTPAHQQAPSSQTIPATTATTLLLSPSVFSQVKSDGAQDSAPSRVLSRSQLQATLLHLIQTDRSFLDTIYDAYVSHFFRP
ncbi:mRNA-decapping enzyme 1B [Nerophis lumbriciformis]|uniref:mRNA-decapping enzyme 1B n=1 Tax=Nerophis lumbriciformis TaxID=546530 RepID=UPI002AE010BD|nr:mRNA-decapping enzyme 1B-like [Nerophis lumbriciformis]XP_061815893.1 mRNA-decapping enzyme 1B-like [Nerophis lumbriciformis]